MSISGFVTSQRLQTGRVKGLNFITSRYVASALCALIPLVWVPPALAKDSVPDWVRAAVAQTIPSYSPETNAVVLLNDTTYTVAPDDRVIPRASNHRVGTRCAI